MLESQKGVGGKKNSWRPGGIGDCKESEARRGSDLKECEQKEQKWRRLLGSGRWMKTRRPRRKWEWHGVAPQEGFEWFSCAVARNACHPC